jgi:non-ribosomal peptide synthetase component E (peptide arylation enzyme)
MPQVGELRHCWLKPGQEVGEAETRTQLHNFAAKGIISRYRVHGRIAFVAALSTTLVGKLDKKVLRERYARFRG